VQLLVFNAGSSSLKFELAAVDAAAAVTRLLGGTFVDAADGTGEFVCRDAPGMSAAHARVRTLAAAAGSIVAWLADSAVHGRDCTAGLAATVHRVVHGGELFRATTRLDAAQLAALRGISDLAPLHNPLALAVIDAVRAALGHALPVVCVFDTAYYASLAPSAYQYAVPPRWRTDYRIRRYGFHGTAHRSLCRGARALLGPAVGADRIISLQLGRGCSVTATRGETAIATSMGFTPLEGLVMGTRSGDLDPGALLYVMEHAGLSPAAALAALNGASGLLGLSGRTADMRELLEFERQGDDAARLAIDVFCLRARHYLGAYLAELGGVEAIAFGGGIGENCPDIRRRILGDLSFAGIELSVAANDAAVGVAARIATAASRAAILVVPVDEARVIALEAAALLQVR
jgi:acetate kinase